MAGHVVGGQVYIYAQSLGGTDNLNLYQASGQFVSAGGSDVFMTRISDACKTYDNFVSVNKEVKIGGTISDFENYREF